MTLIQKFLRFLHVKGKYFLFDLFNFLYRLFFFSRYRVWNLRNYEYLFDINGESVSEVKISPGIVIVIHYSKKTYLPLSLLSIETGEVIKKFIQIIHRCKRIDLVEQFNEFLLLKQEGCNLRIINVK